jgi:hypothetical protein
MTTPLQYMGYWETDETVYVVEEYASKNDLQQDSLSHPERWVGSEDMLVQKLLYFLFAFPIPN